MAFPLRSSLSFPDGTTQSAAAASIFQTEVDFGATPTSEQEFMITDASVASTSQIMAQIAYEAPADSSKMADEATMDAFDLITQPGSGQFKLYAACSTGKVIGKFKVNYLVG